MLADLADIEGELWGRHDGPPDFHSPFLTDAELAALPPLEWDIDGILPSGGLSYLVGQPGAGKTLLAIWWACCISLGTPFIGRAVKRGAVIYVAAEGSRSLHSRLEIWKSYYDFEGKETGVRWFPRRLALRDRQHLGEFITAAAGLSPRLVIVDTVARCTQGTKENDPDGMGQALDAADQIREMLGTGVLLLAHPSREGSDSPRGHSSQDGAADAIWVLKDQDGARVLSCAKLKDGDEGVQCRLVLVPRWGSACLIPEEKAVSSASLTPGQVKILGTIRDTDYGTGVSVATIVEASKMARSSVHFILKHLHDAGYVSVRSHRWSVTAAGLVQLSSRVSSENPVAS